jgi:hypothetical protein
MQTLASASPSSTVAVPPAVLRIKLLGRPAAAALRSESRWEVRAVFRRSFYCRSRGGSFVCIAPVSLGSGPLNVLYRGPEPIDWEATPLATGAAAVSDGELLRVAGACAFSLVGAETWIPATPAASWQPTIVLQNLAALTREARTRAARGGLQALLPVLAETGAGSGWTGPGPSPLVRMALPSIAALAEWLETGLARPQEHAPVPMSAVEALIGLGPGLTPSGDDCLGGVLVALRHLGASEPANRLATAVLSRAERRTHDISRAHLAAAAGGEGLAPLHAMLSSLCTPGALDMHESLSAIDTIGHTSGWDALVGVALATAIVARSRAACRDTSDAARGAGPEGGAHRP